MSQQDRAPRVLFPFQYDGTTYAAATVPTKANQVLQMPDGTFLEPTSWIHSSPRPRIGFAHRFTEPRADAEIVKVWELVETTAP